jgi:DNA helicase IV
LTDVQASSTVERELAIEQAHVDLVYARLAEATRSAQQVASAGRALYRSDRESYLREEDGTGLYERDVFAFQAAKRLAVLDAEHEGLVFGRLDRTDGEVRYVGRIGIRDADYEPLVVDWRAPAAEPFYRATPSQPMQVVRRRVLHCRGDRVTGIEDDLLDAENARGDLAVIGEGALLAALSRARGHTMRDIVATIQAEQDEAIRAPYQGFTMISGGPGTGKTVVALHRAAFLLYSNRRRFESGGVLVVGPSNAFMNYIERVLPSLGEDAVTLRPIGGVASDVVRLRGERLDPPAVAAVKGSLRMAKLLRRLAHEQPVNSPTELRVTVKGHVLVLPHRVLGDIRADTLGHHKVNLGRSAAERGLLNALWRVRPTDLEQEREEFDDLITDTATFERFMDAWWPSVAATEALARLADPGLVRRLSGGLLSNAECDLLAANYADLGERPGWTVADSALLDELVHLLGPLPEPEEPEVSLFLDPDTDGAEVVTTADRLAVRQEVDPFATGVATYAHILVDEAQDISPMQWRMLRRRGPSASWTIVGDPAQSSWPDAKEAERAITEMVGTSPIRNFRMSTNYRSPAEVFDLAAKVVQAVYPEADRPQAVRSVGIPPRLAVAGPAGLAASAADELAALLGEVDGTVGVIVAQPRLAAFTEELAAAGALPSDRVRVVSPTGSKGLEYDAVLVVEPDEIIATAPGGVRALYVALTRPTQRLVTLDAAPGAGWRRSLGSLGNGSG